MSAHETQDGAVEAVARLRAYIAEHKKLRGIDIECIHGLHIGTERECELRLSDIEAVIAAMPDQGKLVEELVEGLTKIDEALWKVSGKRPKRDPSAFVGMLDEIEEITTTLLTRARKIGGGE